LIHKVNILYSLRNTKPEEGKNIDKLIQMTVKSGFENNEMGKLIGLSKTPKHHKSILTTNTNKENKKGRLF